MFSQTWLKDGSGGMRTRNLLIIRDVLRDLVEIELGMSRHGAGSMRRFGGEARAFRDHKSTSANTASYITNH